MNDRLDALHARIAASVPRAVRLTRKDIGGTNRLEAARTLDDGSERYLQIAWVGSAETPLGLDVFSTLGGWYGNEHSSRNVDGRQWGSADHTLQITLQWLVELVDDWPS